MNGINLSELLALDKLLIDTSFTSLQILLSLTMTFLMAMFVYFVYKKPITVFCTQKTLISHW